MIHPIKHLSVILKHRHMVIKHCFKAGILGRGLLHDLSKFSPTEFIPGVKYYQGSRSPNEQERDIFGYSLAWMHHKGRNTHHVEYWTDYSPSTQVVSPVRMPGRCVKEMFCDRIAASKIYQGKNYTDQHPLTYFRRGNARKKMHAQTADLLEEWFVMLAEQGEKATFAHIRSLPNREK